jgi:deoxyadenosine/deoxycytidine kinase
MGKLTTIVGVTGAGKTTLVRALCNKHDFALGMEQHDERPFQALAKSDAHFTLANQVDYLLLRARQELVLRQQSKPALVDGGLDLDFHGFTKLFFKRGFLGLQEYNLCKDLYAFLRSVLPGPDLIIRLKADHDGIAKRLATRQRINLALAEDLVQFDDLIDEWLSTLDQDIIITIDTTGEDISYLRVLPRLLEGMRKKNIIIE